MIHPLKYLSAAALSLTIAMGVDIAAASAASVTLTDAVAASLNEVDASCSNPITRTFTVTDTFSIAQIQLGFNATHTYRGDIRMTLTRTNGGANTSVTAIASNGSDGNNNYDILITSGLTDPLDNNSDDDTNTPLFDREVGPSNSLAPFIGQSANGTWTISICDVFNQDGGTYNQLQLILRDSIPPTVDLDQNNSSGASGSGYIGTFSTNTGGPVSAADTDVSISNSNALSTATITLTNRPDGNTSESLDVALAGAGDLTKNYNPNTGVLTLSSASGIAPATLASVLSTLTYDNNSPTVNTAARIITVVVTEASGEISDTAVSTININVSNPPFNPSCSASGSTINSLFILDDSGSISATEQELQRQALMDTVDYFLNNNIQGQIGIVRFSTNSSVVLGNTALTLDNRATIQDALANNYGSTAQGAGNLTNWEAGFSAAISLNTVVNPDIVFFFTDGTQNNGGSPLDEAAVFKENGTHLYTVGIDELGDQPNSDIDFFRDITDGPSTLLFNGTNTSDADYLPISDFNQLRDEFNSLISTICPIPNVLLVKRITAINGQSTNLNDGTDLSQFVDVTTGSFADHDSNPRWPINYIIGEVDAGVIQPGDEIEYTVYFYNVGAGEAVDVFFCDRLQPGLELVLDTFGPGQDIELELGNDPTDTNPNVIQYLTAANDGGDRTQFIAAGESVPTQCNLNQRNDNGTLVLQLTGAAGSPALTTLPGSPNPGTTVNAYGAFRFVTRVSEDL